MTAYYSGQGKVYAGLRSSGGVPQYFTNLGNCSALALKMGMAFVTNANGGSQPLANGVRSGDMPRFTLTMEELNPVNLAQVLYGQSNTVSGGTVTGEAVSATAGSAMPLANMNLTLFSSLKNSGGTITYVKNVDYYIDYPTGMLEFPSTSTVASTVYATYTYASYTKVSAGTIAPPFYWLRFQGLNTGNTGEAVVIDLYKVRMYPMTDFPVISDAIAQFPIDGRIFKDTNQTFTLTDGQFLRVRKV